MIRNYTGDFVHIRQQGGELLTLIGSHAHLAVVVRTRVLVGEEDWCRVPLVCERATIRGLPEPDYARDDFYLVPLEVLAVARVQGRCDCYALDPESARVLAGGPIGGVGLVHSLLLTPYEWAEGEQEADEPVIREGSRR